MSSIQGRATLRVKRFTMVNAYLRPFPNYQETGKQAPPFLLPLEIRFEKLGNGGIAGDGGGGLEHIMALIVKDQIVGLLSGCMKLLNHIPRLALNDAGIDLALNPQQRECGLLHVGGWRAFQEELPVALRVADHQFKVGLPAFGDTLAEGDQIIGSKHIHRRRPEFRVARCLHQRHVATIGASDHASPLHIDALVLRQYLDHSMHMVQPVFAAKVVVYPPGIAQSIARAASHIGYKDRKAAQRQILNQRHREPGEVGSLLALWPAMKLVDQRARSLAAPRELRRVEPDLEAQPVARGER